MMMCLWEVNLSLKKERRGKRKEEALLKVNEGQTLSTYFSSSHDGIRAPKIYSLITYKLSNNWWTN